MAHLILLRINEANKDLEILLHLRSACVSAGGTWGTIGGGLDQDEKDLIKHTKSEDVAKMVRRRAALRETIEEGGGGKNLMIKEPFTMPSYREGKWELKQHKFSRVCLPKRLFSLHTNESLVTELKDVYFNSHFYFFMTDKQEDGDISNWQPRAQRSFRYEINESVAKYGYIWRPINYIFYSPANVVGDGRPLTPFLLSFFQSQAKEINQILITLYSTQMEKIQTLPSNNVITDIIIENLVSNIDLNIEEKNINIKEEGENNLISESSKCKDENDNIKWKEFLSLLQSNFKDKSKIEQLNTQLEYFSEKQIDFYRDQIFQQSNTLYERYLALFPKITEGDSLFNEVLSYISQGNFNQKQSFTLYKANTTPITCQSFYKEFDAKKNDKTILFYSTNNIWEAMVIALLGFDPIMNNYQNFIYTTKEPRLDDFEFTIILNGIPSVKDIPLLPNTYLFTSPSRLLPLYIIESRQGNMKPSLAFASNDLQLESRFKEWKIFISQLKKILCEDRMILDSPHINEYFSSSSYYSKQHKIDEILGMKSIISIQSNGYSNLPLLIVSQLLNNNKCGDHKKILLLVLNNVNAKLLAKRLTQIMDGFLGKEAGYILRDHQFNEECTSLHTKIEFQTYTSFLRNYKGKYSEIIDEYYAIIMDQTHIFDINIYFSYIIIRNSMKNSEINLIVNSDDSTSGIHSIISSMEQIDKIDIESLNHINIIQSNIFRSQNRIIENEEKLNGSSYSAYSLKTILNILKESTKGNILVYLPSKNHVINVLNEFACQYLHSLSPIETSFEFEYKSSEIPQKIKIIPIFSDKNYFDNLSQNNESSNSRFIILYSQRNGEYLFPEINYIIDTGYQERIQWILFPSIHFQTASLVNESTMKRRLNISSSPQSIHIQYYNQESLSAINLTSNSPLEFKLSSNIEQSHGDEFTTILKLLLNPDHLFELLSLTNNDKIRAQISSILEILSNYQLIRGEMNPPQMIEVTDLGLKIAKLSLPLYPSLFLVQSMEMGAISSAVRLASLFSMNSQFEILSQSDNFPSSLIHSSGDHLTLLQVYEDYLSNLYENKGEEWCSTYHINYSFMRSVDQRIQDISSLIIEQLGEDPLDQFPAMDKFGGRDCVLLIALSNVFNHQMIISRKENDIQEKFFWPLPKRSNQTIRDIIDLHFLPKQLKSYHKNNFSMNDDGVYGIICMASQHSALSKENWKERKNSTNGTISIFSSITFSDISPYPSINLISFIPPSLFPFLKQTSNCNLFDDNNGDLSNNIIENEMEEQENISLSLAFANRLEKYSFETIRIELNPHQKKFLLNFSGRELDAIRSISQFISTSLEDSSLSVTLFKKWAIQMNDYLKDYLQKCYKVHSFTLSSKLKGSFIGARGRNISKIKEDLLSIVQKNTKNGNDFTVPDLTIFDNSDDPSVVTVQLLLFGPVCALSNQLSEIVRQSINSLQQRQRR